MRRVLFILCFPALAFAHFETYFAPASPTMDEMARDRIRESQSHILAVLYDIDSPTESLLLQALIEKRKDGKTVRLLLNKDELLKNKEWGLELEKWGIDVRTVSRTLHHKFLLIDHDKDQDGTLLNGSSNWTLSSRNNDENLVISHHEPLHQKFRDEFEYLWKYSTDFPTNVWYEGEPSAGEATSSPQTVLFTRSNFVPFKRLGQWNFKTTRHKNVSTSLSREILSAQKRVWVASTYLRSYPLAQALLQVAQRGNVDVRVILDGQEYISITKHREEMDRATDCLTRFPHQTERCFQTGIHYSYQLKEARIPVRFKYYSYRWHHPYAQQLHHKYVLIDNVLYSGSYNWSHNSETNSFENLVRYDDTDVISAFENNFLSIWDRRREQWPSHIRQIREGDKIPLHFSPLSLKWEEIRFLKNLIVEVIPDFYERVKPEHQVYDRKTGRPY